MKLRIASVERSLRRAIRREVKASPALRAAQKRVRKSIRSRSSAYIQIAFLTVMGMGTLAGMILSVETKGALEYALMIHAVGLTGFVILTVPRLVGHLFASDELQVLQYLPVSSSDYFRRQLFWTCRRAGIAALYTCLLFGALWYGHSHTAGGLVAAVGMSLLEAAWCLSLVWLGARYIGSNLQGIGILLVVGAGVLFFARDLLRPMMVDLAPIVIWLMPAGWGLGIFHYGWLEGRMLLWLMLLPMGGGIALLWPVVRQCAKIYRIPEPFNLSTPPIEPERLNTLGSVDRAESTAKETLGATTWQPETMPVIERTIWRRLTERERVVAQFLLADGLPPWSRRWLKALAVPAITLIVSLFFSEGGKIGILMLGAVVSLGMTAPVFGGNWVGLTPTHSGFGFVPLYAYYPISYREISLTILKINCVRCLTWLPLAVLNIALMLMVSTNNSQDDVIQALIMAVKSGFVLAAMQPLWIVYRYSRGSNDSELPHVRASLPVGIVCLGSILTLAGCITALIPHWLGAAIGFPVVILVPAASLWLYIWCLRRWRLDVCRRSL